MKKIILLSLLLILSIASFSQLHFDSISTAKFYNNFNLGSSTVTLQHTCSGTNRVLVVSVMSAGGVSGTYGWGYARIKSLTYNGINLNQIVNDSVVGGLLAHNTCWYLSNPPTGTHNIVVKYTDYASSALIVAFSFNGVNTTNPIGANNSLYTITEDISLPITTTAANSIIVDFVGCTNGSSNKTILIDSNQTLKYNTDAQANDIEGAGGYRQVSAKNLYSFYQTGYSGGVPLLGTAIEIIASPTNNLPIIGSPTYESITSNSATLGGNITSNSGCAIISRGVCWGLSPTAVNNCVTDTGFSTGVFRQVVSGLPSNSVIYYKAFASNCVGTSFTTLDNFTTNQASGITQIEPNDKLIIIPNPSNGNFKLYIPILNSEILITNLIGEEILKYKSLDIISELKIEKQGVYFLYISNDYGTTVRKIEIN